MSWFGSAWPLFFWLVCFLLSGFHPQRLIMGEDRRFRNSKFQTVLWFAVLARAIEDQELMFDEDGLRDFGADAAATCKSGDGGKEMDEKGREIAHIRIVTRNGKLAEFRAN